MAIVIDGITLPEFPEVFPEVFSELDRLGTTIPADYPYRVVFGFAFQDGSNGSNKIGMFALVASMNPMFLLPAELTGAGNDMLGTFGNGYFITSCYFNLDATDGYWLPIEGTTTGAFNSANPTTQDNMGSLLSDISGSNYDILKITSVNETTGDFETEIYFPNSETPAEPEYGKIKRQHMRDIGDAIRRKTGKKDKIPTPQLASEIDSIVTADGLPVAEEYSFGTPASEYGLAVSSDWIESQYGDNYTQGWTFTANETIDVVGLRHGYSNANGVSKTLALWDNSGNLLKSLAVKGNVNLGEWVDFYFDEPITLQAGQNYTVSCRSMYKVRTSNFSVNPKITYLGFGETASSTSKPSYGNKTQCVAVDIILANKNDTVKPSVYQISLSTLDSLSFVTQRIVGNPNVMTPAQMISALESVATATVEE